MSALLTTEPANPEDKGVNELLLDINQSRAICFVAKLGPQILADMFTLMLALFSGFKYRPLVGAANYLYRVHDEWSSSRSASFVRIFLLQCDMSWTIAPSTQLSQNNPMSDALTPPANTHLAALAAMNIRELFHSHYSLNYH
jgi:hypothetical protein